MTITDRDPGDEDMNTEDSELLRAIARFENGDFTPEEEAEMKKWEAEVNAKLREGAREHDLILAWSKVHGANKVYK